MSGERNLGNVIGGHKATLNNDNVSDEAKQHSKEVLEDLEQQAGDSGKKDRNLGNVIGGHKAAINNPNVSDEAKQHSKEVLDELEGGDSNTRESTGGSHSSSGGSDGKNPDYVARGLKATITNPNTSEEAKQSAQDRLDNM